MNSRTRGIIEILCEQDSYVTIEYVSKTMGVSTRTILRELSTLENWIKEQGLQLIKKPKVGIKIEATQAFKRQILQKLHQAHVQKIYTPKERQDLILLELTQKNEPIKQYYFSSIFDVSEATISHDLDKLDDRVKEHRVTIFRKPGLGIFMVGDEKDKRHLIVHLLYEYLEKEELYTMMHQEISKEQQSMSVFAQTQLKMLNIIDPSILARLEVMVDDLTKDYEYPLADSAKIGLIVHLALVVKRVKNNESIPLLPEIINELLQSEEYVVATVINQRMGKVFSIPVPESENAYIAMHLKGSRLLEKAGKTADYQFNNFEVVKLANQMIRLASELSGSHLMEDQQLLSGLVAHLKTALIRLKLDLEIRNPLLDEIKERYAYYFELSKKATEAITEFVNKGVPDAEIGFVAMHLGSAIERHKDAPYVYRAIVTCTAGIGSSKMLATRINQEFSNIEVVKMLSTIDIHQEDLIKDDIDLMISTVETNTLGFPTAYVSPMLNERDIAKIRTELNRIKKKPRRENKQSKSKVEQQTAIKGHQSLDVLAKASRLKEYSESILDLFTHLNFILDVHDSTYIGSVNAYIRVAFRKQVTHIIKKDLFKREALGGTVLKDKGILLMHCKTKGTQHINLGVVRPKSSFMAHGESIQVVLFLVAPIDAMAHQLNVLSEISQSLIKNKAFAQVLVDGDIKAIQLVIEEIYDTYLSALL